MRQHMDAVVSSNFEVTEAYGIDLKIGPLSRAKQWARMVRSRSLKLPYRLRQGDLTRTPFSTGMFDVGICISVIEHGVPLELFLKESYRILRPGAPLLVTTDYWEPRIELPPDTIALPGRSSARRISRSSLA